MVTNTPNDELIVKKNPDYWQAGRPYLDQITFKTVGSDEAAYEALLANQGQVYENMSTTQLITESAAHFEVENNLGTSPYDLQLNTAVPPFNNPKARQAIYAATNFQPILQHLFGGRYPIVQGFTGPGGICYQQYVPGYQGYDPTLAKTLIQQTGLDNTTIQLGTIALSTAQESMQALATEWEALGLHVKLSSWPLSGLIAAFEANGGKSWQSMVQTAGAYDPAAAIGVDFRFNSHVAVQRGARPAAGQVAPARRRAPRACRSGAASTTRRPRTSPRTTTGRSTSRSPRRTSRCTASPGPALPRRWPPSRSCRRSRGRTCTTTPSS